jgi:hypothetical protein
VLLSLLSGDDTQYWHKFIGAVLERDYAVGYLLLTLLGRGTLVLSTLMTVLNGAQVSPTAALLFAYLGCSNRKQVVVNGWCGVTLYDTWSCSSIDGDQSC